MSKIIIDQKLCDTVRFMYAGGATTEQIAGMTGASATTVRRIRRFGFSAEEYAAMNANRREAESKARETKEETETEEQVPGQISMEQIAMAMAEEQKPAAEIKPGTDEAKMMRFLAGKFDDMLKKLEIMTNAICHQMEKQEMTVFQRVDKINDNICQILRKMDGG